MVEFDVAGKNLPRYNQMNINVATWGRLLKKNINLKNAGGEPGRLENDQNAGRSNLHGIDRSKRS